MHIKWVGHKKIEYINHQIAYIVVFLFAVINIKYVLL